MKKKKKENKRLYPSLCDPKYGEKFFILGMQLINIDGVCTELLEFATPMGNQEINPYTGEICIIPKLFSVGKDIKEWKRNKEKISDEIVIGLNKMRNESYQRLLKESPFPSTVEKPVNYMKVTVFKIRYTGAKRSIFL